MKKLFIFILLLFGMISMSFAALTDNNTAYWTLDNTLVDATGNGYTLTNNGANFITGKINEGLNLNFAEADYLETGVSNIGSSSYTLNIWAIADDTTHQKIMSKDLASGSNREFQMNFDSNSFQFIMWVETGTAYSYDYLMTHSTFQMISIVVNDSANNFKMYVNGALVHTEPISTTSSPRFNTAAPLYIGNAVSTYFDGKIDEPSIWGRALSDSEILELYNSGNGSQYPYAPPAPAQSIEFTNISLVNNSIYNSNFTIQINLTNTSTNANINTSYSLIQNYSIPTREGYKLNYINLATRTSTANQFCIEKGYDYGQNIYGTTIASEQMYLYLASTWSLAFSTEYITSFECVKNVTFGINTLMPNATININSFDEGNHSIYFYAANNETNATSNIYYFFTDITNPIINQIANISNGSFIVNFSTIINVTELNPSTCFINITELENVTTPDNFYINCTDTQVFTSAGLHNFFVTATDIAGNIDTYSFNDTITPFVELLFYDSNLSAYISNYSVTIIHPDNRTEVRQDTNGSIFLSPVNNGVLDLGLHTIEFNKATYVLANYTIDINESSGGTNQTFNVNGARINIFIYDISSGNLVTPSNFTLFYLNEGTGASNIYTITNNNKVNFSNPYLSNTIATLNLINVNGSLVSTRTTISPQKEVNINLYINTKSTIVKNFEVYTADLVQITFSEVMLYVNIPNTSIFVLQNTKLTDIYGQVSFNIVPNSLVYNVCNTYNGVQKCLNQQVFDTSSTPIPIVHDSTLDLIVPVNINDGLIWSKSEVKGASNSQITFTFEDTQALVSRFCINVSRFTNNIRSHIELRCLNDYEGQIIQTYSLTTNQYLEYTLLYTYEGNNIPLTKFNSYFSGQALTDFKNTGLIDYLFLILIFVIIGGALGVQHKIFYSIIFLGSTLIIYSVQSYINSDYIIISIWGILAIKHILFYYVITEG